MQRKPLERRPGITDPPVAPCAGCLKTKQKHKPNHQRTGLPPLSALPIRGKTNNQQQQQQQQQQ